MDEYLIDDDSLSLSRKSLLPGTGFFYPDTLDEEYAEQRTRKAVEGAETVVVADTDADGLACAALIREANDAALDAASFESALAERLAGDPDAPVVAEETDDEKSDAADDDAAVDEDDEAGEEGSPVALVAAGPHNLGDALARVAEFVERDAGVDVYVCDLCPDSYDAVGSHLEALVERTSGVRWFDHHQWDEDVAAAVRAAGVDLVVGDSDEECTADVALRSIDYDFPERFHDLAAVTRDHDLWLREDPRSDDLADYAHWTDAEEYVAVVGEHGPDLPETAMAYVEERRVEKEALVDLAVERAEFKQVGPWTVGVTYGRCSQNEVAEAMREQGSDAAVVVKPAGSASLRGTDEFQRCHEVARQVNGGGHPKASGCKPDIYDDMLDYAHHWTTQGSAAKRVILAAFERVAEAVEAESEADAANERIDAEADDEADDAEEAETASEAE